LKKIVYLQKIGDISPKILITLRKNLKWTLKEFIDSVKIIKNAIPIEDFPYNPISKQYDATYIFRLLDKDIETKNQFRTLGIIDEDIYAGPFNFIFGRAKYPRNEFYKYHGLALISVARLHESFYRRPANDSLFELRTLKEAIHELGHTFDMPHCENICVMRFSNHLDHTDKKPYKFCKSCREKLNDFFKTL
jgi:archaemetzincin